MNRDTLTGILGAVVLVAAMVGVFQYERTVGAERVGLPDTGFQVSQVDSMALDGRTALGESTEETVPVNASGVVNVTFALAWTAGQGQDTLVLEVTPPDGVPAPEPQRSDSGAITLTVPVANAEPDAGSAPGTVGLGDWTLKVTFESASGLAETPAGPVGGDGDVAWTLGIVVDAWQPVES